MKRLEFLGDSWKRLQAMPASVHKDMGHELRDVQKGLEPSDWKVMPGMPSGVKELRVKNADGAFRALYVVKPEAIVVLNLFQKKSQAAPKIELDLARKRLKDWENQ